MRATVRSAVVVALLVAAVAGAPPAHAFQGVFADDDGHPLEGFIETIANLGITAGCAPDLFCPDAAVRRDEMAVFLGRAFGYGPVDKQPASFVDIAGNFASTWIEGLVEAGVTAGCGAGRYCPGEAVTRGEMAVFLARALTLADAPSSFADTAGHFALGAIGALAGAGITAGCTATMFCPETSVTRAEMAVFLTRALGAGAWQPPPGERKMLDPVSLCLDCTLVDPAFQALPSATAYWGIVDGVSAYRIEVPGNWDGRLVLSAHGFTGINDARTGFEPELRFGAAPNALGIEQPLREELIGQGIAWAASAYRSNGYVPALGADELLRVKDVLASVVGSPTTVYATGESMGGATTQLLLQEFPDEVQGGYARCGALSNVEVTDYIVSWHAVAAWLLGGPPPADDAQSILDWAAPLQPGAGSLAADFEAVMRELTGGPRWGFEAGYAAEWQQQFTFGIFLWPDVDVYVPGGVYGHVDPRAGAENVGVDYTVSAAGALDAARLVDLNSNVIRFDVPDAVRADPALGPGTGFLGHPLLTVKTTGDMFTPISLEAAYAARVSAAGYGANLVERAVRHDVHCALTNSELLTGWADFLAWAEGGVRPAGEDLSADLTAAGVLFTDPCEPNDPLC